MSDELKESSAGSLVLERQPVQVAGASSPGANVDPARRAHALEFIASQLLNVNTKLERLLNNLPHMRQNG